MQSSTVHRSGRLSCCMAFEVIFLKNLTIGLFSFFVFTISNAHITYATEYSTFWTSWKVKYPKYLNDDKNYILIFAHSGDAWYLDKTSIKIEVEDPPYYVISANTIFVRLDEELSANYHSSNKELLNKLNSYTFFYDEEEVDMRLRNTPACNWDIFFGEADANGWHVLYPPLNWGMRGTRPDCVGEAVFYIALGRKFYGNFLWNPLFFDRGVYYMNDNYKPEYLDIFNDKFYESLQ